MIPVPEFPVVILVGNYGCSSIKAHEKKKKKVEHQQKKDLVWLVHMNCRGHFYNHDKNLCDLRNSVKSYLRNKV